MDKTAQMTIPDVHSFEQIVARAKEKSATKPARAVLVDTSDAEMVSAFEKAAGEKLIEPVSIAETKDANKVATVALQMAAGGEVDLIVKGGFPHIEFLRQMLDRTVPFVGRGKLVSHIGVIDTKKYGKLLFITDAGLTVQPDLKQKLVLIQNAAGFAAKIGVEMPRVALLAAVEVIYPQMPVTTDAAILAKMSERKQIKGCLVDGPLSFDVAIDMAAAHSKGITSSEVAGQADILVASTIETAHGIYTAMSLYGKAEIGGVVVGGKVPVALASRSDSASNKYRSIALAILAT